MLQLARTAAASVANALVNKITLFFDQDNKLKTKDENGLVKTVVTESTDGTSTARPYLVYTALLTQTAGNAPIATVLENTLGGTVAWAYTAQGTYEVTSPIDLIDLKVVVFIGSGVATSNFGVSITHATDKIYLTSVNSSFASTNGLLINTPIEIRVYL